MEQTLAVARIAGQHAAFLYGDPNYYCRFGFRDAKHWVISTVEGGNLPAFMAIELSKGALSDLSMSSIGIFRRGPRSRPPRSFDGERNNRDT